MDALIAKVIEDGNVKTRLNIPWLILQVKNDMVDNSLLYVVFDKPLHQFVGLTLKGREIFRD